MRLISQWYILVLLESYLLLKDPRQISIQILSEFKRINLYSLWNHQKTLIVSAEISESVRLTSHGRLADSTAPTKHGPNTLCPPS